MEIANQLRKMMKRYERIVFEINLVNKYLLNT